MRIAGWCLDGSDCVCVHRTPIPDNNLFQRIVKDFIDQRFSTKFRGTLRNIQTTPVPCVNIMSSLTLICMHVFVIFLLSMAVCECLRVHIFPYYTIMEKTLDFLRIPCGNVLIG